MSDQTKKERKLYDLSEVEEFLDKYNEWYERQEVNEPVSTADSNPGDPPPPPPGPVK